ncbi:hypothetical protein SELMODRAFT_96258 [Selaginella moellendorffii]|uniref:Pentacotripeptide-repeat region of PRORP domain-containing protein n=1 Tax=Selaginella moellendorffii TaxID=88036 RepID=D8RL52_SELML|nr:hypothetical protein SELMODRAFT_96258 [Selaginella moellendorffii]
MLDHSRASFDVIVEKDVASWNALLTAYAHSGYLGCQRAICCFFQLDLEGVKPDFFTFVGLVSACTQLEDLSQGTVIHRRILALGFENAVSIQNALVYMYAKCGCIESSQAMFDRIIGKDVVAWTALITAIAKTGQIHQAMELFLVMDLEGIQPSVPTFAIILSACSSVAQLVAGRAIHRKLEGLHDVIFPAVVAALLNLYGRCGSLAEASALFNASHKRTVASWNAMIAAYAQHGHLPESLDLVHQMQLHGSLPDKFTYIEILQACSHSGTRNLGWSYFVRMGMDHGLIPAIEHYVCVVDLLGRIGQLELAERVVKGLPYEPDVAAWNSLLGSCKIQGDMPRAQDTVGAVLKLQAESAAPYVLLANLYAAARRWEDVATVRKAMADRGIRKPTGRSFQCL